MIMQYSYNINVAEYFLVENVGNVDNEVEICDYIISWSKWHQVVFNSSRI